jgi:hypothetical protein
MASRSSSMSSPPYKISSSSTNRFRSYTHRRNLNIRHFGTVEATALNSIESRSSSMLSPHTRLHPNSPIGSKVIKEFLCTHLRGLNVRHFGMAEATRLNKCGVEVIFNGINSLPNFMKIHRQVQKLLVGIQPHIGW